LSTGLVQLCESKDRGDQHRAAWSELFSRGVCNKMLLRFNENTYFGVSGADCPILGRRKGRGSLRNRSRLWGAVSSAAASFSSKRTDLSKSRSDCLIGGCRSRRRRFDKGRGLDVTLVSSNFISEVFPGDTRAGLIASYPHM